MSKKSRFRRLFHKQHGKRSQTLLKSVRQHFYHIHWSMWRQLSWKKSLLVIWKILGLFVNILTVNAEYSILNRDNLMQPIRKQLYKKQKSFSELSLPFLKSWHFEVLNIFKKKMNLIAYVLPKLQTSKERVRQIS